MSVVLHPEYKKLKNQLSELILEYEELTFKICPNLENDYISKFGLLEYELYKRDVEISKLRRKLQLIQIHINNGEEIDMDFIMETLKREFAEYEQNLKKQMIELQEALNTKFVKILSKDELKRLKLIYKQCILKLHPDLNDNISGREKELFVQIVEAFKKGDLATLEGLYYLIPGGEVEPISDIDRLNELIEDMETKINELKENFPYNKRELLMDEERCEEYKNELKTLIKQFDEKIREYDERIIKLI